MADDTFWRDLESELRGSGDGARRLVSPRLLAELAPPIIADPDGFAAMLDRLTGHDRPDPAYGLAEAAAAGWYPGTEEAVLSIYEEPLPGPRLGLAEGDGPRNPLAEGAGAPLIEHAHRVGLAFRTALLPGLPDELVDLDRFFAQGGVPAMTRTLTNLDRAALAAAGDAADGLERFGISPLSFAVGARSVARGLRRHCARHEPELRPDDALLLTEAEPARPGDVSLQALSRNLALSVEVDDSLGSRLLGWLVKAAYHRERIFDGFVALTHHDPLRLRRSRFPSEVALQWSAHQDQRAR